MHCQTEVVIKAASHFLWTIARAGFITAYIFDQVYSTRQHKFLANGKYFQNKPLNHPHTWICKIDILFIGTLPRIQVVPGFILTLHITQQCECIVNSICFDKITDPRLHKHSSVLYQSAKV